MQWRLFDSRCTVHHQTQHGAAQHSAALHNTAQCNTLQQCTVQHCTAKHSTALYSAADCGNSITRQHANSVTTNSLPKCRLGAELYRYFVELLGFNVQYKFDANYWFSCSHLDFFLCVGEWVAAELVCRQVVQQADTQCIHSTPQQSAVQCSAYTAQQSAVQCSQLFFAQRRARWWNFNAVLYAKRTAERVFMLQFPMWAQSMSLL